MRRLLRRVPAPLALLLAVVAFFGATWALIVPAWMAPDEDAHFAYTSSLAERGQIPGGTNKSVSEEQRVSMDYTNTDATVFFPYAKPNWTPLVEHEWQTLTRRAKRDDGGGSNATSGYPPAYYLFEELPYKAASSTDVLSRLYVMRWFSVIWLLVTTTAAWLLAGEVFGKRRPLQLVTAATAGLWPMLTFISSAINPDGMLVALWSLSAWLGASLVLRGPNPWRAVALALCVGVAMVTKASALALIPPAVVALAIAAWPLRTRVSWRRVLAMGVVVAAFALPVAAWVVEANHVGHPPFGQTALVSGNDASSLTAPDPRPASPRLFASYLWQYYLPKLWFMDEVRNVFPVITPYPAMQVWLASGWASFGWVNVWFTSWVYYVFLAVAILFATAVLLTVARAIRARRWRPGRRLGLAVFFAVMFGALWAGLHLTDYRLYVNREPPFLQGRYLLPLAPLFALLVAQATRALPERFRPAGQGVVLGGLLVFQFACLGLVASRYYA